MSFALNWVIADLPFDGAAPPFGSKDEGDESESESDETATTGETLVRYLNWALSSYESCATRMSQGCACAAPACALVATASAYESCATRMSQGCACAAPACALVSAANDITLPDSLTSAPGEHDDAIDHSEDGTARDTSAGFASAARLITGQPGITKPISKLPPPPPGAAEKAKKKEGAGRGVEGDESADPMSTLDKFNWDNLPLPGLGQI